MERFDSIWLETVCLRSEHFNYAKISISAPVIWMRNEITVESFFMISKWTILIVFELRALGQRRKTNSWSFNWISPELHSSAISEHLRASQFNFASQMRFITYSCEHYKFVYRLARKRNRNVNCMQLCQSCLQLWRDKKREFLKIKVAFHFHLTVEVEINWSRMSENK